MLPEKGQAKKSKQQTNRFLLCLDNIEDLIKYKGQDVQEFIKKMNTDCSTLSVVMTSSRPLHFQQDVPMKTQILGHLSKSVSAELFVEYAGVITEKDVYELMLMDEHFPIGHSKLGIGVTKEQFRQKVHSQEVKDKIMKYLKSPTRFMKALENHDMFRQLNGNPLSIRWFAALHANDMMKNCSLKQIYQEIKDQKASIEEQDDSKSQGSKQSRARKAAYQNRLSIQMSTEASVHLLR